jgi:hypothetical protein
VPEAHRLSSQRSSTSTLLDADAEGVTELVGEEVWLMLTVCEAVRDAAEVLDAEAEAAHVPEGLILAEAL